MKSLVLGPDGMLALHQRGEDWLSSAERDIVAAISDGPRRNAWLGGRWLMKSLVQSWHPSVEKVRIHVESRNGRSRPTAPQVFIDGKAQLAKVSVSHAAGYIIAAGSPHGLRGVGCDLVELNAASPSLVRFWFNPAEQAWLRRADHPAASSVMWGLKEAIYKSQDDGRPFQPALVDVGERLAAWGLRLPTPLRLVEGLMQRSTLASYTISRVGPCLAVILAVVKAPKHQPLAKWAGGPPQLPAPSLS